MFNTFKSETFETLKIMLAAFLQETVFWRCIFVGFAMAILGLVIMATLEVPFLVLGLIVFGCVTFYIAGVALPKLSRWLNSEDSEKLE